ncbi:hypothetical protein VTK26DRAFT_8624 [Humicola hyalothermophila]
MRKMHPSPSHHENRKTEEDVLVSPLAPKGHNPPDNTSGPRATQTETATFTDASFHRYWECSENEGNRQHSSDSEDDIASEGTQDGDIGNPSDRQRWDIVDRIMKSFCSALESKIAAIESRASRTVILDGIEAESGEPHRRAGRQGPRPGAKQISRGENAGERSDSSRLVKGSLLSQAGPSFLDAVQAPTPVRATATVSLVQPQRRTRRPGTFVPAPLSNNEPVARSQPPPHQSRTTRLDNAPYSAVPAPAPGTGTPSTPVPHLDPESNSHPPGVMRFRRSRYSRRRGDEASTSENTASSIPSSTGAVNSHHLSPSASESQHSGILTAFSSTAQEGANTLVGLEQQLVHSVSPEREGYGLGQESAMPVQHDEKAKQLETRLPDGQSHEIDVSHGTLESACPVGGMSPDSTPFFNPAIQQQGYPPMGVILDTMEPFAGIDTSAPTIESQAVEASEWINHLQRKRCIPFPERKEPETSSIVPDDRDGDGRRKRAKKLISASATERPKRRKKFACPYYKRNPRKYRKWTSCPGPGWEEVHRVKTHLYRRHQLPIQCPRCWEAFKADGELQQHLQQDPPCTIQENQMYHDGFTKDQEKRLRSRRRIQAEMTDEDKWREIYRILFPDDDETTMPSPYYCDSDTEDEPRRPDASGQFEDYVTFIRREMPTLVRRELEALFRDEFRDVEERVRPRVADIILSLQPRLLNLYKQSQMPLSEYGPQQHTAADGAGEASPMPPAAPHASDSGASAGPNLTPDTTNNMGSFLPSPGASTSRIDPRVSALDANWIAFPQGYQVQLEAPAASVGLDLNWDFEFEKLLEPMVLIPTPGGYPT